MTLFHGMSGDIEGGHLRPAKCNTVALMYYKLHPDPEIQKKSIEHLDHFVLASSKDVATIFAFKEPGQHKGIGFMRAGVTQLGLQEIHYVVIADPKKYFDLLPSLRPKVVSINNTDSFQQVHYPDGKGSYEWVSKDPAQISAITPITTEALKHVPNFQAFGFASDDAAKEYVTKTNRPVPVEMIQNGNLVAINNGFGLRDLPIVEELVYQQQSREQTYQEFLARLDNIQSGDPDKPARPSSTCDAPPAAVTLPSSHL